jgi:hypothetical protein
MIKKVYIFILIVVVALTPVFLTGCVPGLPPTTPNTGEDTGGDTGDDTGDDTSEEPVEMPILSDYFDGVKLTYNPDLSGDLTAQPQKEQYVNDVKEQVNTMSKEFIIRLMSEYGNGVGTGGYRLSYSVGGEYQYEDIYEDGFDPFDADPVTYGTTYTRSHKDAVRRDYYNQALEYFWWNWTLSSNYNANQYIDEFISAHSTNLQIAIFMIKLNKDVHIVDSEDYDEYIANTMLDPQQKEDLKQTLATQMTYIGLLQEEMDKLKQFILNVMIGEELVDYDLGRFNDLNQNDIFDAEEFVDANSNGEYDLGEVFNDLNKNGVWDAQSQTPPYETANNYFKNYVNTVEQIVEVISENTVRYPQIAGIQFQDYVFSEVEATTENPFVIPTGMQNYKSLIFMNSQEVNLDSIWLAFESTRNFNLEIVARYHKTGQGVIYDGLLDTLEVTSGQFNIPNNSNDFYIDIKNILSSEGIENNSLSPFVNNTESYDESLVLNTTTPEADYFIVERAESGQGSLAKYDDNSTDFFELIFNATPIAGDPDQSPITFKFGFLYIEITTS